jgi:hypothetical protein
MPSSLDILEHFFDHTPERVGYATVDDLAELYTLVAGYFDRWRPPGADRRRDAPTS